MDVDVNVHGSFLLSHADKTRSTTSCYPVARLPFCPDYQSRPTRNGKVINMYNCRLLLIIHDELMIIIMMMVVVRMFCGESIGLVRSRIRTLRHRHRRTGHKCQDMEKA